ncbi:hypothetical protein C8R47DRAFT_1218497 [Mycena vitilis]|nr:hypothetical protein C8R47DRAFT_1218497 [Mycena vitilis]
MFLSPLLILIAASAVTAVAGHASPRSVSLQNLGLRQSDGGSCIECPDVPACACASDEQCFVSARSCIACATVQCVATGISSSPSSAASSSNAFSGALPGPLASSGSGAAAPLQSSTGSGAALPTTQRTTIVLLPAIGLLLLS